MARDRQTNIHLRIVRMLSAVWLSKFGQSKNPPIYILISTEKWDLGWALHSVAMQSMVGARVVAFGPRVCKAPFSVMGKLEKMPFKHERFHIIWREGHELTVRALYEIYRTLKPRGFFIVDTAEDRTLWNIIESVGFERLPMRWGEFSVFQKNGRRRRVTEQRGNFISIGDFALRRSA